MKQHQRDLQSSLTACAGLYGRTLDRAALDSYWEMLKGLDQSSVIRAVAAAPAWHPGKFPDASQIAEIARERARGQAVRAKAEQNWRTNLRTEKARDAGPPDSKAEHKAYVGAGKTPFEKLARMWECESKALGLTGNAPTPDKVGNRRWVDFWQVWKKAVG